MAKKEISKPVKKKEYKFPIAMILKNIVDKNFDFYSSLSEEDRKYITPLTLMRWMSSIPSNNSTEVKDYFIENINDSVNIGFWSLSKHNELLWKMLCSIGTKMNIYHDWIPSTYKKKQSKIDSLLVSLYPLANKLELSILRDKLTKDKLYNILIDRAYPDEEIRIYLDELNARTK